MPNPHKKEECYNNTRSFNRYEKSPRKEEMKMLHYYCGLLVAAALNAIQLSGEYP